MLTGKNGSKLYKASTDTEKHTSIVERIHFIFGCELKKKKKNEMYILFKIHVYIKIDYIECVIYMTIVELTPQ